MARIEFVFNVNTILSQLLKGGLCIDVMYEYSTSLFPTFSQFFAIINKEPKSKEMNT